MARQRPSPTSSAVGAGTNVSSVLPKLDLRDRAQIVVTAYEGGLVTPGG